MEGNRAEVGAAQGSGTVQVEGGAEVGERGVAEGMLGWEECRRRGRGRQPDGVGQPMLVVGGRWNAATRTPNLSCADRRRAGLAPLNSRV